jgi:hypothetical protein
MRMMSKELIIVYFEILSQDSPGAQRKMSKKLHGTDEKCIQSFGWKSSEKGDCLEGLRIGVDGRIILKCILRKQGGML